MKKNPLILTVVFFILSIGGYFLYARLFNSKSVDIWNLIPESSALVYEAGACKECIVPVKQSSVWKIVHEVAFNSKSSDSLKNIVALLTDAEHTFVSLHVTNKDDFDFIFYTHNRKKDISSKLDRWKGSNGLRFSEREFNSVKIQEVAHGTQVFSWLVIDDIWVGSFTPFLVEDVIRTYQTGKESGFKTRISDIYQLPRAKNDAGNIYIQLKNFADCLNVFLNVKPTALIQEFGRASILDIKLNEYNLVLNGFSSDTTSHSKYALSLFSDQNPVPFNIKKLVSNRTVMLTSYGISSGLDLKNKLMAYAGRQPALNDTLRRLSTSLDLNLNHLFENINGEVGICFVESKGQEISKVMLIETAKPKVWLDELSKISSKLSADTIFYDKFSDYEIRELALFRFPEKIFWPLASGFDRTYYTTIDNTIVFAEDIEELKKFLEDVDREETWGKSVSQNKYLESTLLEANISLYINTPLIWNVLLGSVNSKWRAFIEDNEALLQSLGMGAIQFSHLSESFYTNVSWSYQDFASESQRRASNQKIITKFGSPVSKMFAFKSHVDKSDEAFVQDSSYNVHLISTDGNVLWTLPLDGMIAGDVEQIDYYNNGKLQFVFSTHNKLHVVDRLGNYIKPFPVSLAADDIEYTTVIDYDHSKKYRFLLAGKSGKLWMYDKDGKNLEGWQPKDIDEGLHVAPKHHRIRGKDYIIAIRKDGDIYLLSRRGEVLKNFPLSLNIKPSGGYFLESGGELSTTYFVIVSRDGYRVKFNLEGKIKSKETLLKNSPMAQFTLIKEQTGKSYLLMRQEEKQLTLMDESESDILKNDFIGIYPIDVKYVDFGAGKVYITITDTRQDLSFIYDAQGHLLTNPPIESSYLVARRHTNGKLKLFSGYGSAVITQLWP